MHSIKLLKIKSNVFRLSFKSNGMNAEIVESITIQRKSWIRLLVISIRKSKNICFMNFSYVDQVSNSSFRIWLIPFWIKLAPRFPDVPRSVFRSLGNIQATSYNILQICIRIILNMCVSNSFQNVPRSSPKFPEAPSKRLAQLETVKQNWINTSNIMKCNGCVTFQTKFKMFRSKCDVLSRTY